MCIRDCGTEIAGDGVEENQKFLPDGKLNLHTLERCQAATRAQRDEARVRAEKYGRELDQLDKGYCEEVNKNAALRIDIERKDSALRALQVLFGD